MVSSPSILTLIFGKEQYRMIAIVMTYRSENQNILYKNVCIMKLFMWCVMDQPNLFIVLFHSIALQLIELAEPLISHVK